MFYCKYFSKGEIRLIVSTCPVLLVKNSSDSNEFSESMHLYESIQLELEKLDLKTSRRKLNNNIEVIVDYIEIVINTNMKRACNKIAIGESRKLSLQTTEDFRKNLPNINEK